MSVKIWTAKTNKYGNISMCRICICKLIYRFHKISITLFVHNKQVQKTKL